MSNWRKLATLSWAERAILAQALFLLPINALALRWVSLKRWRAVLVACSPLRDNALESPSHASILAQASLVQARLTNRTVDRAVRYGLFNANCLHRSLTLWWLLRRHGISSELKVGARIHDKQCQAHAWVEYSGEVLNDSEDVTERFPPFNRALIPTEANIQ
jgi:hypothetical protein